MGNAANRQKENDHENDSDHTSLSTHSSIQSADISQSNVTSTTDFHVDAIVKNDVHPTIEVLKNPSRPKRISKPTLKKRSNEEQQSTARKMFPGKRFKILDSEHKPDKACSPGKNYS